MTTRTMNHKTANLSLALRELQQQVIGLFRPSYYSLDNYIPVIENDNGSLTCVEVGGLLGLSTLHIESSQGRYVKFPSHEQLALLGYDIMFPHGTDPVTLDIMMEQPILFHKWYKENVYKGEHNI